MARKQHIIALTGFAGVGKDTVADLLVTHLGFVKLAFGDALRAEVAEAFDVDMATLSDPRTKHLPTPALAMARAPLGFVGAVALTIGSEHRDGRGMLAQAWLEQARTPRQVMQWWGTEYRRRQSANYWTRQLAARLAGLARAGHDRMVVTDCRFANEADCIHGAGGRIWQVTRPGIEASTTTEGHHVSATDGSAFHPSVVLSNSHDIAHLQRLVFDAFMELETAR
ncbi:hypothetical protein [Pseudacidovorax sp. RU35E]|uniref:hypothetical protein n=1 Tax=Pseudacidovorax sp. RU35E TaxID=1907403 RepID=UPI000954B679|nr:hypothetical protein [Pseudacidovorax sp. RU35E]SIR00861.1 hypothetical protein SAMN05880557_107108 [Pseudacidovorax sp. RU35E]